MRNLVNRGGNLCNSKLTSNNNKRALKAAPLYGADTSKSAQTGVVDRVRDSQIRTRGGTWLAYCQPQYTFNGPILYAGHNFKVVYKR